MNPVKVTSLVESFFNELVGLEEVRHLSNAHLAWFVVRYERENGRYRLRPKHYVLTKLDSTVKALTGGTPLPQDVFENQILKKLINGSGGMNGKPA